MIAILLLNADMSALKTVSLQRAIGLISKERADIIESVPGGKIRSPSVTLPLPSVLRLRKYVNVPKRKQVWSRRGVFNRDGWKCVYCNRSLDKNTATIDHIVPRIECKKLGIKESTWSNTCSSCESCNKRKSSRSLRDSGMKFFDPNYEPKTPRANYLIASGDIPSSWRVYLEV